jgi:DUF1680 family protein
MKEKKIGDDMSYLKKFQVSDVYPKGWLLEEMTSDLVDGYVGHLDELVPDLIKEDDIYGKNKLGLTTGKKSVGALNEDEDTTGQFMWWNSETQCNWLDGFVRHAFLVNDKKMIKKAHKYMNHYLSNQEENGYLGIYDKSLRYQQTKEHGELWSQTTLYRTLLGYYQFTKNDEILNQVIRAVEHTMESYPQYNSRPFLAENEICGVSHGLCFIDVLVRLFELTNDSKYMEYALFLYEDYSISNVSENDATQKNLLDKSYKFKGHGVHTYEHLRAVILAAYMSNEYDESLNAYLSKLEKCFTPSGGPIGDEWIYEKDVSSSFTGYEYCSIQEAMDSYITLFRYSKNKAYADKAEWIFNNAAFGSKSKELKAITYLNTDNSYQLDGTRPDEDEHQTRYRFSATHKEAAVCCVPNAGRVIPYYMHNMWLLEENVLYKTFYGPSCFETVVNDKKITIEEETSYPYSNRVVFKVASVGIDLDIKFRIPSHSKGVLVILDNKKIKLDVIDGFVTIPNHWTSNTVEFVFDFKLQMKKIMIEIYTLLMVPYYLRFQ